MKSRQRHIKEKKGEGLSENRHTDRAAYDEKQSGPGSSPELFFQKEDGKSDGDENAQFIDRNDDADNSCLNGIVIAKPGSARRNSRQNDKQQISAGNRGNEPVLFFRKNNRPGNYQYHCGADCRAEIGFDSVEPYFCKNGGQSRKHRRQNCIHQPFF